MLGTPASTNEEPLGIAGVTVYTVFPSPNQQCYNTEGINNILHRKIQFDTMVAGSAVSE